MAMFIDDEGWLHWNFERPDPPRMFIHTYDEATNEFVTQEYMDDGKLKEVKRVSAEGYRA